MTTHFLKSGLSRRSALAGAIAATVFAISPVLAEPKDDVAAVLKEWAAAFSVHDVERILKLYSPNAVLWGTTAISLRSTPDEIREYFVGAFRIPNVTVSFDSQTIRIFGNTAVVAGSYTFTARRDGHTQDNPARYSFTLVKEGDRWLIVDHNSSHVPGPRTPVRRT